MVDSNARFYKFSKSDAWQFIEKCAPLADGVVWYNASRSGAKSILKRCGHSWQCIASSHSNMDFDDVHGELSAFLDSYLKAKYQINRSIIWMIQVLATLVVISISTYVFLAVIFPLGIIYYFVQRFYVATSRQLKRLESVSRSPIYSHFSESLQGASTIRAYNVQDK